MFCLSNHNICFGREIRNIISFIHSYVEALVFLLGMHCLVGKRSCGIEKQWNLKMLTHDPLKNVMDPPNLIVQGWMGGFIHQERVN